MSESRFGKRVWLHGFAVLGVLLAAYFVHRGLSRYNFDEIVASIQSVPAARLLMGAAFAAASYLCLTGFDWLALRYAGRPLPYRQAAIASFTALSLGHNIGFAALSSGAIRYRFYTRWGLSAEEVARVVLFCGVTVGLGLAALAGLALLVRPDLGARLTGFHPLTVRGFGAASLAIPAVYLCLAAWIERPLRLFTWTLPMPPVRLAAAQIGIGTLNFVCVAGCLHAAIGAVSEAGYWDTAAAYVAGNIATLITHVPGGLGVIETAVMHLVPGTNLIGPLLVFRATYFLMPLCLGVAALLASEMVFRSGATPPQGGDDPGQPVNEPTQETEGACRIEQGRAEHRP